MSTPDLTPIGAGEAAEPPAAVALKIVVPAIEPVAWPKKKADGTKFKLQLPPPRVWEYRYGDGSLHGVVARWDRDGDKIVLPAVCVERDGTVEWAWSGFGDSDGSRPLLGLMELAAKPLANVLLVEGEKTRDAAARYMPDSWVCVTWQGGAQAIRKTDWSPLAGRRVVLWMDKDAPPRDKKTGAVLKDSKTGKDQLPPGEKNGLDLFVKLTDLGAGVAMVPVYGGRLSMIPNNGWDLADDLPEGLNPREWMEQAASMIQMPQTKVDASRTAVVTKPQLVVDNSKGWGDEPPEGGNGVDETAEYRALGFSEMDGGVVFHFFSARSGFILTIAHKALCSSGGPTMIVNNDNYWRAKYNISRDVNPMPWRWIGQELENECYDAGYFEVEKERGRGAWLDKGRVVMHLGNLLIVDGQAVNPTKMVSEYYYPRKHRLLSLTSTAPLSDAEGKLLRQISREIGWKNPFHAELFCGWLATAGQCGAYKFRTHLWLTGSSMSGKTWVVNNIVKPCFGDLSVNVLGDSTAAGIKGRLGRDARPVIFDEAEGKGTEGEARRQMVIQMMRYSSSETDGHVVKGTATHGVSETRLQSQFFLASIGVGISEMADMTRTLVAPMRKRQGDGFGILESLVLKLPKDLAEKLLRRQLGQLKIIRENAETYSRVITLKLGNARLGDMIGTLMAGDHSLISQRIVTFEEAEDRVTDRLSKRLFIDFTRVQQESEDIDLLRHLMSWQVPIQGKSNVRFDRPIGEAIHICIGKYKDEKIEKFEADDALRRLGLKREKQNGVDGFWVARQKSFIATRVMSSSTYSQGWDRILATMPGAIEGDVDESFAGAKLPALWVPAEVLLMGMDNEKDRVLEAAEGEADPTLV